MAFGFPLPAARRCSPAFGEVVGLESPVFMLEFGISQAAVSPGCPSFLGGRGTLGPSRACMMLGLCGIELGLVQLSPYQEELMATLWSQVKQPHLEQPAADSAFGE